MISPCGAPPTQHKSPNALSGIRGFVFSFRRARRNRGASIGTREDAGTNLRYTQYWNTLCPMNSRSNDVGGTASSGIGAK